MNATREVDLALLMADLSGYTALTETHGALTASETVLRFAALARSCLESGVTIVDSIGDSVFCAGEDTLAIVRTALRLRDAVAREPGFPRASMGIHRGALVEREGRLFGAPINLTARLTAYARGGQILCTEPIARSIGSGMTAACRPAGTRRFKNVPRAVPLYELVQADEGQVTIAIDPVCHMQVTVDSATLAVLHEGVAHRFCSAACARLFSEAPDLYVDRGALDGRGRHAPGQ